MFFLYHHLHGQFDNDIGTFREMDMKTYIIVINLLLNTYYLVHAILVVVKSQVPLFTNDKTRNHNSL